MITLVIYTLLLKLVIRIYIFCELVKPREQRQTTIKLGFMNKEKLEGRTASRELWSLRIQT